MDSKIAVSTFLRRTGFLLVLLLWGTGSQAMTRAGNPDLEARADSLLREAFSETGPGGVAAIMYKGKLRYAKGFGMANLEHQVPMQATTRFHVASISKQFTAFSILLLAKEGNLSLTDDIHQYLPELPDLGYPIQIQHLLYHISGMRDFWELLLMGGWRLEDVITDQRVSDIIYRQKGLRFAPGEKTEYCNTGYYLLAKVVEKVSGQSFPEFTQERIFKPLGMEKSYFTVDYEKLIPNNAASYAKNAAGEYDRKYFHYEVVGNTGLKTTAIDFAKWLNHLNRGTIGGKKLVQQMFVRGVLNKGDTTRFGIGLHTNVYRGLRYFGHAGGDAGFRTYMCTFPGYDLGICVFSNGGGRMPVGVTLQLAGLYLDGEMEKETVKKIEKETVREPKEIQLSAATFAPMLGKYELFPGFIVTLSREKNRLVWSTHSIYVPRLELVPESDSSFLAIGQNGELIFRKDEEGRIDQFVFDEGRGQVKARKLPKFEPSEAEIRQFTGKYYSPEIGTPYHVQVEDGQLVIKTGRDADIALTAVGPDRFVAEAKFKSYDFLRDENNNINGIKLWGIEIPKQQ